MGQTMADECRIKYFETKRTRLNPIVPSIVQKMVKHTLKILQQM